MKSYKPDYPNTYYEIRANSCNDFYTLGSRKSYKEALEVVKWWRKTDKKGIFKVTKAINTANGVITREDIKEI